MSMTKIAGSISQRHGSTDPDPDPDPPQNVMDPQHCLYYMTMALKKKVKIKYWPGNQTTKCLYYFTTPLPAATIFCRLLRPFGALNKDLSNEHTFSQIHLAGQWTVPLSYFINSRRFPVSIEPSVSDPL